MDAESSESPSWAAAVQDADAGVVVGEATYGKASGQKVTRDALVGMCALPEAYGCMNALLGNVCAFSRFPPALLAPSLGGGVP